jgi:hypothetical protein
LNRWMRSCGLPAGLAPFSPVMMLWVAHTVDRSPAASYRHVWYTDRQWTKADKNLNKR